MKLTINKTIILLLLVIIFTSVYAQAQDYVKHKVKAGETLSFIAEKYKLSKLQIIKANPNLGRSLPVGYDLTIPIEKPQPEPEPQPKLKPEAKPQPKITPKPDPQASLKNQILEKALTENKSNIKKFQKEITLLKSDIEKLILQNSKIAKSSKILFGMTDSLKISITQQGQTIQNLSEELQKTKENINSRISENSMSESGSEFSFDLGADLYSRYVWRGTDFGNTPAIQPYISYSIGSLEIGAWSSWSVTGAESGNENDLYLTYSFSNFSLTITDYFFPAYIPDSLDVIDDLIDDFGEEGGHTIEISCGLEFSNLSLLAGMNVTGNDPDNSKYFELGYSFYNKEDVSASFFAGVGDGFYTLDAEFNLVNFGISLSKERYTASYIINPDQKTSFLIFGVSF